MIWILIVTTWVYGGATIGFQEFTTEAACKGALTVVKEMPRMANAACVPKS